jgi:SH3-like domain-containing protein
VLKVIITLTALFNCLNNNYNAPMLKLITMLIIILFSPLHSYAQQEKLPIPRFASLKFAEVNVRTGPGEKYPVKWIMKREKMPVEIIGEYEYWRRIEDIQGDSGWVHKSQLSGKRMGIVIVNEALLYKKPSNKSGIAAKAERNAMLEIDRCEERFCIVTSQELKGWTERTNLWGVYEKENIE